MSPLEAALDHLRPLSPSLVIAYGSFAQGRTSASSDVDVVVFADVEAPRHDGTPVAGHPLDAWIHPLADLADPARFLRVWPALVLHDPQGRAPAFLAAVEALRREAARPLTPDERVHLDGWIAKMLVRATDDDVEGNYRYRWLVQDYLELWCRYGGRLYEGPKKALALLAETAPEAHATLAELLAGPKEAHRLAHLYRRMTSPLEVLQGPRVDLVARHPGPPRVYEVHEKTTGVALGEAGWEAPEGGRARLRLWIDPAKRLRGYGAEAFALVAERFFAEGGRVLVEEVPQGEGLNALLRYGFRIAEEGDLVQVVYQAPGPGFSRSIRAK